MPQWRIKPEKHMGEVADMVLDGTLCQKCGALVDEEAPGFPRDCADCRRDHNKARGIRGPDPISKKKLRTLRLLRDGDKPWAAAGSQCESLQYRGYVRRVGDIAQITNAGLAVLERATEAAMTTTQETVTAKGTTEPSSSVVVAGSRS
jgi:hypothetical protein